MTCSGCGAVLKPKTDLAGKKVRCPKCGSPFVVPGGTGTPAAPSMAGSDDWNTLEPRQHQALEVNELTAAPNAANADSKVDATIDREAWDFLAPPEQPDEIGRFGSYRVLKVLGAGGMGVVFQAEDVTLKRLVALKAMRRALAASPTARQRFLREAQTAASIEHDHIMPIYQVDEDRGVPFIAMPFLNGEPLDVRLARDEVLPVAEVLRIGRECALGLAAAHAKGLVHRDIKPANLWLEDETRRVKILDFGLARSGADNTQLTQQGAILGTPGYMAPEQAAGQPVDARCDLFSLGCVLYRMAAGEAPFQGRDGISTFAAVATTEPLPPIQLRALLPPALSDLIMLMLAKEAQGRPPSATAVVEALQQIERSGAATPARSAVNTTKVKDAASAAKRRSTLLTSVPWVLGGGVACVLLVLLWVVGLTAFWPGSHPATPIALEPPDKAVTADKRDSSDKDGGKQKDNDAAPNAAPNTPPSNPTPEKKDPASNKTAQCVSLQSYSRKSCYVRHAAGLANIWEIDSERDRRDASFYLAPGLANPKLISFRSYNSPQAYLRHAGGRLRLNAFQNSSLYRGDATFKRVAGLADNSADSFELWSHPGHYIHSKGSELWTGPSDGSPRFAESATFKIVAALCEKSASLLYHEKIQSTATRPPGSAGSASAMLPRRYVTRWLGSLAR
jgi:serine/threonine protein kinase